MISWQRIEIREEVFRNDYVRTTATSNSIALNVMEGVANDTDTIAVVVIDPMFELLELRRSYADVPAILDQRTALVVGRTAIQRTVNMDLVEMDVAR